MLLMELVRQRDRCMGTHIAHKGMEEPSSGTAGVKSSHRAQVDNPVVNNEDSVAESSLSRLHNFIGLWSSLKDPCISISNSRLPPFLLLTPPTHDTGHSGRLCTQHEERDLGFLAAGCHLPTRHPLPCGAAALWTMARREQRDEVHGYRLSGVH